MSEGFSVLGGPGTFLELIPHGPEGQLHAFIEPLLGARNHLGTGDQSGQRLGGQRGPNPAPPFRQQLGSQREQCPHSIVVSATQAANSDAQPRQRTDLSDTGWLGIWRLNALIRATPPHPVPENCWTVCLVFLVLLIFQKS